MRPTAIALALLLVAGCGKKEEPTSSGSSTAAPASKSVPAAQPAPRRTDDRLKPGVWLSVNGRGAAEIPRGWPVIVTATVLGAKGAPIKFMPDDVGLEVRDATDKKLDWPMKRISAAGPFTAEEASGATISWIIGDLSPQPEGSYRLTATLKDGASDAIPVKLVPAQATPTPEMDAERFALEVRAALLAGDPEAALRRIADGVAAQPSEPLVHVLKGDVLASLGKNADAAAAYREAIRLYAAKNPKAKDAPVDLLRKLASVSAAR